MATETLTGKLDQLKGQVEQTIGEATGNDKLANSGTADQIKGAAKEAWGNTKDAVETTSLNAGTHTEAERTQLEDNTEGKAHNVRDSLVNSAQNLKDSVISHTESIKNSH